MDEILDDNVDDLKKKYTFKILTVIIWSAIFIIGYISRNQHWPLGGLFIAVGSAGLTAYSLCGFILLKGKNILNNIFFVYGILWTIYLIKGALTNGIPFVWSGVIGYGIYLIICFTIYKLINKKYIR